MSNTTIQSTKLCGGRPFMRRARHTIFKHTINITLEIIEARLHSSFTLLSLPSFCDRPLPVGSRINQLRRTAFSELHSAPDAFENACATLFLFSSTPTIILRGGMCVNSCFSVLNGNIILFKPLRHVVATFINHGDNRSRVDFLKAILACHDHYNFFFLIRNITDLGV